ncbi:hypothetical protein DENSPDRAFT_668667 [Dentipellis sp. KUC8613]|nr:hypothetical protein DENSPDRAFT_668667 [Dentipellis sp. KUC8613]
MICAQLRRLLPQLCFAFIIVSVCRHHPGFSIIRCASRVGCVLKPVASLWDHPIHGGRSLFSEPLATQKLDLSSLWLELAPLRYNGLVLHAKAASLHQYGRLLGVLHHNCTARRPGRASLVCRYRFCNLVLRYLVQGTLGSLMCEHAARNSRSCLDRDRYRCINVPAFLSTSFPRNSIRFSAVAQS